MFAAIYTGFCHACNCLLKLFFIECIDNRLVNQGGVNQSPLVPIMCLLVQIEKFIKSILRYAEMEIDVGKITWLIRSSPFGF